MIVNPSWRALLACTMLLGSAMLSGGADGQTVGPDYPIPPSITYGPLYTAVELSSIFPDSKTFPDLVPTAAPDAILSAYQQQSGSSDFNLAVFVAANFTGPTPAGPTVPTAASGQNLLDYITSLWTTLTQSASTVPANSTLLPVPYPYVVPGGRFRENYYWDSYFAMLGLVDDGEQALASQMLANFAFEIDQFGFIPNGNRSYYLSRSQPPFFSLMVDLLASHGGGPSLYVTYLPELVREWNYWMKGAGALAPGQAAGSAVRLADGTVLNRYYDDRQAPRDESYLEDVETVIATPDRAPGELWQNLRATAASGWDFSSRWLADGKTLGTDRALDIVPPDLNALLAHLEERIAFGYALKGDVRNAVTFAGRALNRAAAINRLLFDEKIGAYTDYLWQENRQTDDLSAATLYPLFLTLATPRHAKVVAATVQAKLLDVGGLQTTLVATGQQWDYPNGWAPLQWIAVQGLRNYGQDQVASEIASRWIAKNIAGFEQYGQLVEKYNVSNTTGDAGSGGEYATQVGFGWTNGVIVALTHLYPTLAAEARAATYHPEVASVQ